MNKLFAIFLLFPSVLFGQSSGLPAPIQPGVVVTGPPSPGQVVVATSSTTAAWQNVGAQTVYVSQVCSGTQVDLNTGLTAAGGAPTDFGSCINTALAAATPLVPVDLVVDGQYAVSGIFTPAMGNVRIRGYGGGIAVAPCTAWSINGSNVLTMTCKNAYSVGMNVILAGFTTGSFLNDQPVKILTASSTQFTAAFTHATASATEAGEADHIYGSGFYQLAGSNNDVIHNGASGANVPQDPNTTPPQRGANFAVEGIIINGNRGNGTTGNSNSGDPRGAVGGTWYFGINVMNMNNVFIDHVQLYNTSTYGFRCSNCGNVHVDHSLFTSGLPGDPMPTNPAGFTNQDGVHINGYGDNIFISNSYFRTGDDAIALNSPEGYCGPITRVTITNVTLHQVYQGGRAYTGSVNCSSGAVSTVSNVTIDNMTGDIQAAAAWIFGLGISHTKSVSDTITGFTISNSRLTGPLGFMVDENIGDLTFDNVELAGMTNATGFLYTAGLTSSTITNLVMNNDSIVRNSVGSSANSAINCEFTGSSPCAITKLYINGFKVTDIGVSPGAIGQLIAIASPSTISTFNSGTNDYTNITALADNPARITTTQTSLGPVAVVGIPSSGQVPTAISGFAATWQTPVGVSWATPTTGTATSKATFPGGDLFNGGVNAQTGTTYTMVAADENKTLTLSNGSAVAVSLPQATTTGFGAGAVFDVVNLGAGSATITPTTSTINGASSLVLATGQSARITSDGTNYIAELGAGAGGISGTSPIVVSGSNISCPTCSTGSGTNVQINGGSTLGTANLNDTTPAAPAGGTNVKWQVSGSNVSAYLPPVTGSISISQASIPGTLNLTTDGTLDWIAPVANTALPRAGSYHGKALGGYLQQSFDWVQEVASSNPYSISSGFNPSLTSNSGDDLQVPLSSSTAATGIANATGGATNYGFRVKVPAGTGTHTLKIYCSVFSGTATLTAKLSDGSASTATDTLVATAGNSASTKWTITYNAAKDGQTLFVSLLLTTNLGSGPAVNLGAITLQ